MSSSIVWRSGASAWAVFLITVIASSSVNAAPFTLSNPFVFRDNRDGDASIADKGDFLQLDVGLAPSDVPAGTTASARNLLTGEVFPFRRCTVPRDRCAFFGLVPYTTARAMGSWEVTAVNDGDTATLGIPAFGTGPGTGALPFVENIVTVPGGFTPTFTWDLPVELIDHLADNACPALGRSELNDCNVDRLRVRVRDADAGLVEIFDTRVDGLPDLALDATSFALPAGVITRPGNYAVAVMVEGFGPFTRSRLRNFFRVTRVPEPATLALLGFGLAGLATRRRRE